MADSGSCTAGTRVATSRKIRIRMKGDHARNASPPESSRWFPEVVASYSAGTGASFLALARKIRQPMQMTAPMMSGSCGPMNIPVRNSGITKERDAASVMPTIPFRAFTPPPKMMTMTNGEIRNRRHSISATFGERTSGSIPVTVPSVTVGTPTDP